MLEPGGVFTIATPLYIAKNSDIDLLVELDYNQPIGLEFIQMKLDLQELLSKKVDLVSARGLSKYIKPILDNEKKLIYAR